MKLSIAQIIAFTTGRTIIKVKYDSELHVLALELDSGDILMCHTETIAKAMK